jgi:hypothetical protein
MNTIAIRKTTRKKNKVGPEAVVNVIPLGQTGWVVKRSDVKKFSAITNSMREAVSMARLLGKRNSQRVIVFGKDGSIRRRLSHAK